MFDTVIDETAQESAEEPKDHKKTLKVIAVLSAVGLVGAFLGYGVAAQQVGDAQAQAMVDIAAVQADADTRVAAEKDRADTRIAASESQMQEREATVSQRESDAAAKESAVAGREAAVTQTEAVIDASRIGPGTYLVPDELTAGRYRTVNDVDGDSCYMKQSKGNDIIDNMLEDAGRPVFTVQNVAGSEFLIDSDCGPVTKIN